jgi:hypothetical protein
MYSSKKSDLERDFVAAIYLSEAPSPCYNALYKYIYPYLYLFTRGRDGVLNHREGDRVNMTECTHEIGYL